MARIIKSRVKVKELPEKFKIIKKEPPAEVIGEEETEEEQEQGLEQTNFTPRASSSGLEAPVLEASSSSSQSQFSDTRERKKDENNQKIAAPEYQTAMVYGMPDYAPSQPQVRQQPRTEAVIHPTLISETVQRQTTRIEEWHELSQARTHAAPSQDAVIGSSRLENENKLPFQQDSKYHPRKKPF